MRLTELFYNGLSSVEEEDELYRILTKNPEYMDSFRQFTSETSPSASSLAAWNNFKEKIDRKNNVSLKLKIISPLVRYAAVFVLAFLCFWLWSQHNVQKAGYCELIVPKGQKSQLVLPDGTKIWINSDSKLRYPANFSAVNRQLEFTGEAFFDVAHDSLHPFEIQTHDYNLKVLGTQFNLMSYEDLGRTETALFRGRVEINLLDCNKTYMLKPGEKLAMNSQNKEVTMALLNNDNVSAWKDNQFIFEDLPFNELCVRLSRWYDVEVRLESESLKNITYSGKFKNKETIWQVMDIIKTTTPIEYTLNDRILTIYKRKSL